MHGQHFQAQQTCSDHSLLFSSSSLPLTPKHLFGDSAEAKVCDFLSQEKRVLSLHFLKDGLVLREYRVFFQNYAS